MIKQSGVELLRNRSVQQLDWIIEAQNTNASSVHYGAIHSTYELWDQKFTSNDRRHSPGLKVDEVAMMARYLLETWRAVLATEGRNVSRWYAAGLSAAQWVAKQQADDGGLPNRILLSPIDNWNDRGHPSICAIFTVLRQFYNSFATVLRLFCDYFGYLMNSCREREGARCDASTYPGRYVCTI